MDKNEKVVRGLIISIIAIMLISTAVSTVKSVKLGRLCSQLRERVAVAEDTNRRLTKTIGDCQTVCGELGESVNRNIRTAREAVELIEEIRVQVQSLQDRINGDNSGYNYEYWDEYFGLEFK